jgi:hypothetical protein
MLEKKQQEKKLKPLEEIDLKVTIKQDATKEQILEIIK